MRPPPLFLAALPPAKFAEHVRGVITATNETDKTLSEEAYALRGEISGGRLDCSHARYATAALLEVTQADFNAWFLSFAAPGGVRRRAIVSTGFERGSSRIARSGRW